MSTWVFTKIAIIVISIAAGLAFFYIMSPSDKTFRKRQLEEIVSLIINFVLFVWAGKVLVNLTLFVSDPLAVLAYPSDSNAFYAAIVLLLINIGYRMKRKNMAGTQLMTVFIPVFFGSAFVYEFIDIVWHDNPLAWTQMGLLLIIIIIYLLIQEMKPPVMLANGLMAGWSFGQLILTYMLPYVTLFGYMLDEWFFIVVLIVNIMMLLYNRNKADD